MCLVSTAGSAHNRSRPLSDVLVVTSDPIHSQTPGATLQSELDREARVEEILLNGLDHYFAGQHELAINVWTRALFIDRGHARARAYIERARGAIAERQRQGEELIHTGVAAFERGEADTARRLLMSAVEQGTITEEALALLDRIDRLQAASVPQELRSERRLLAPQRPASPVTTRRDRSRLAWVAAGVVLGVAGAAVALGMPGARAGQWLSRESPIPAESAARVREAPLPVPSASDVWMSRAQAHYERGHLHEALLALEAIGPGDRLSVQADRLKAGIQSKLLEASRSQLPLLAPRPQDTPRP
jgi:tetratricopeptide (TPR) repeat protein